VSTNIAGRSRVTLVAAVPRGTVVRVIHGEQLDGDGRVDTTNITLPLDHGRTRQVVEYVATGEAGQLLEPWFCYHGFAFCQVAGLPPDAVIEVEARSLHSDLEEISALTADDPLVGTLVSRARRTLLNNVHGIPEDCPTREQSGWTGDTASVTDFEFAAFDMESFFRKWLGDLRTSQLANGAIPAIAPDLRPEKVPADPVWGAALQRVLTGHWMHYGDLRVIEDNIEMLRRWVDFQLECVDGDGVIGRSPISYGHDWLALDQTPPRLLQTAAVIDSLAVLAEFEAVVDEGRVPARRVQLEQLRAEAARRFVDASTGSVGNGSQASLAVAVTAGLLDDELADRAVKLIEADVRMRGNRVSSGFAATRTVVRTLADSGRSQVVFDALHQREEPGVGAMLAHGPGTMWENWWIDPENTGTGSLDHVGLGGPFAGWAEQYLAGIRPIAPGFSEFECQPRFVGGVHELAYETRTVRGTIAMRYRRNGKAIVVSLTVPVGSVARVILPGTEGATVGSGQHTFVASWSPPAPIPITDVGKWIAPSRMSLSPDVNTDASWLAEAIEKTLLTAPGGSFTIEDAGLRCMPVPHAQLAGPVAKVFGHSPVARIDFPDSVDLSEESFVFAEVDTCLPNVEEPTDVLITLIGADQSRLAASGHVWPAGWNRVAVDLGDWRGRSAVSAVEVAVVFDSIPDPARTFAFHLGSVGASSRRRTW
jgi:alpha-L-rhamnosidase